MGAYVSTYVCAQGLCERAYWLSQGTIGEHPKARPCLTGTDWREEELVLASSLRTYYGGEDMVPAARDTSNQKAMRSQEIERAIVLGSVFLRE